MENYISEMLGGRKWAVFESLCEMRRELVVHPKIGDPRPRSVRRFEILRGDIGEAAAVKSAIESLKPVPPRPGASTRPFFRGHGRYAR